MNASWFVTLLDSAIAIYQHPRCPNTDHDIGTFKELHEGVIAYRRFIAGCERTVPYLDEQ